MAAVTPSAREQRKQFNAAVAAAEAVPMAVGQVYYALSCKWLAAWEAFTNVRDGEDVPNADPPGKVDSSDLADVNHPGAMERGLMLDTDYKLVPNAAYTLLTSWHGQTGIAFPRYVVELPDGTTRVEVYSQFCSLTSTAAPDASVKMMLPRDATASRVLDLLCKNETAKRSLGVNSQSSIRLWARRVDAHTRTHTEASADAQAERDGAGVRDETGGQAADPISPSDSDWLAFVDKTRVSDIARDDVQVDVLVEARREDGTWARGFWYARNWEPLAEQGEQVPAEQLRQWRESLDVGSLLDAFDGEKWYQSAVVGVTQQPGGDAGSDKLKIHFSGWAAKWDQTIDRNSANLQPLYTHTAQWREAVRPGDYLDVCIALPDNGDASARKWFVGCVMSMDFGFVPAHVKMQYYRPEVWNALEKPVSLGSLDDVTIWKTHTSQPAFVPRSRPAGAPPAPTVASFLAAPLAAASRRSQNVPAADGAGRAAGSNGSGTSFLSSMTNTMRKQVRSWMGGDADEDDDDAATVPAGGDHRAIAKRYRAYYFEGAAGNAWSGHSRRPSPPGVCGLDNLGNTCFMNSMLQCLSNVRELTEYMLGEQYLGEINDKNALGSKGHMAHAYAALMQAMWSGQFSRVAPSPVKAIVGKRAPQFLGYGQQDSQEFMSFLLDLLLEDLCRVHPKPSVPAVESGARSDAEVAVEAWDGWQRRNASHIADVFAGQFRSHVQCNVCSRTSVTFDAFTSLSVPVPVDKWSSIMIFYFGAFNARPQKFAYFYRQSEPPTAGTLAKWLYEQLQADESGIGKAAPDLRDDSEAATFARRARIPAAADEILLAWIITNPCMVRQLVPHYTTHGSALSYIVDASRRYPRDFTLFAYRVPHAGAAPEIAGLDRAAAPTEAPSLQTFPFDFAEFVQADDDDEDVWPYRAKPKTRVDKPPPAGPTGPRPDQLATVWCRYRSAARHDVYVDATDAFVVPLTCDSAGLPLRGPITNRQFLDNVYRCFHRLHKDAPVTMPPPTERPYDLGYFDFVYDKRFSLDTCVRTASATGVIPDNDEPFMWHKERQIVLDMSNADHANHFIAGEGGVTLEACLQKFSQREQLGENDKWYCSTCKDHVRAYKQMSVWRLPAVLIIHLKRFQYERSLYASVIRGKIDDMVHFPTRELDLRAHVKGPISDEQPPVYDLFAVSEHSGGLGGGHYTAHGLNWRDSQWYSYNDGHVSPAYETDSVRPSAYVLFYRLRRPGGIPAVPLPALRTIAPGTRRPATDDDDAMGL